MARKKPTPKNNIAAVLSHVHDKSYSRCQICGKPMSRSDVNDTGTLCARCYDREYN